jgi:hypothetical protein
VKPNQAMALPERFILWGQWTPRPAAFEVLHRPFVEDMKTGMSKGFHITLLFCSLHSIAWR